MLFDELAELTGSAMRSTGRIVEIFAEVDRDQLWRLPERNRQRALGVEGRSIPVAGADDRRDRHRYDEFPQCIEGGSGSVLSSIRSG